MPTLILDTHRLIGRLKEAGFTEQQATGITQAIQEIDLTQLPTRADLKLALKDLELRMTFKLGGIIAVATAFLAALKVFG